MHASQGLPNTQRRRIRLELDDLALLALVAAELKVLAALQGVLRAELALGALKTQHNLLGGLGLCGV